MREWNIYWAPTMCQTPLDPVDLWGCVHIVLDLQEMCYSVKRNRCTLQKSWDWRCHWPTVSLWVSHCPAFCFLPGRKKAVIKPLGMFPMILLPPVCFYTETSLNRQTCALVVWRWGVTREGNLKRPLPNCTQVGQLVAQWGGEGNWQRPQDSGGKMRDFSGSQPRKRQCS